MFYDLIVYTIIGISSFYLNGCCLQMYCPDTTTATPTTTTAATATTEAALATATTEATPAMDNTFDIVETSNNGGIEPVTIVNNIQLTTGDDGYETDEFVIIVINKNGVITTGVNTNIDSNSSLSVGGTSVTGAGQSFTVSGPTEVLWMSGSDIGLGGRWTLTFVETPK